MTTAEYHRVVEDGERAKAEARRLRAAIRQHEKDVKGPGPAVDFGTADTTLWAVLDARGRRS